MKYIIPTKLFDEWLRRAESDLLELKNPCEPCNCPDCIGPAECFPDTREYAIVEITGHGLVNHRKLWEGCR